MKKEFMNMTYGTVLPILTMMGVRVVLINNHEGNQIFDIMMVNI